MVTDPVCGMQVDPQKANIKTVYHGQMYYFCSPVCKGTFDREPEKYAAQPEQEKGDHQHQHER